ncbi:MAG: polysaccharide deacetylase family protein [Burkholderiales bacterium]|nr:polysaccharide deacetylase family protein [Burkholderiales bacterium]
MARDVRVSLKHDMFRAVFTVLSATGAHRLSGPRFRGKGAILMLHHVRPWHERAFAPNRLLEVTPEFLDAVLGRCRAIGLDLVAMDDVADRMADADAPPFVAVTFDDGYRDTLDEALPVLRRHGAPATVYVTPGFADRSSPLWWLDLEHAVERLGRITIDLGTGPETLAAGSPAEKAAAFERIYWALRAGPEERLRATIADLAARAGVDSLGSVAALCLDWEGIRRLAADPLVTIGAHTMTHPMLAKHPADVAWHEMALSRSVVAERTGRPVRHFAYPVGDPGSAGPREFRAATEMGFTTAVTTRPGMLFAEHATIPTALPRVSLNGHFQSLDQFEVLMSGLPFWLWNRGRRVNAA